MCVLYIHTRGHESEEEEGRMPRLGAPMDHRGQGNRAVVVSVAHFDPGVELRRRPGADRDAKKLHSTLSKLGFKVELHMDLSGDEIHELFQKGTTHSRYLCCTLIISVNIRKRMSDDGLKGLKYISKARYES